MSALPLKADIREHAGDVRYVTQAVIHWMAAASTFLKSINFHKVSCNKTGGNKATLLG